MQATKKRKVELESHSELFGNMREVGIFVLLALAIFILVALISYHPDDPGWSHAISNGEIQNSAGKVGAWIADVFLLIFGYFGYLIPVLLAFDGWRLFEARRLQRVITPLHYVVRVAGLVMTFLGGCALAWGHIRSGSALPHEVRGSGRHTRGCIW